MASTSASTAYDTVHVHSEIDDVELVEPHHSTGVPLPKCF